MHRFACACVCLRISHPIAGMCFIEQKVRRIRKTAAKPDAKKAEKSLGGFLEKNEPSIKKKVGGSNSVAGDQIAISKEQSLTGEVYVRADGKKGKSFFFEKASMSDLFNFLGC